MKLVLHRQIFYGIMLLHVLFSQWGFSQETADSNNKMYVIVTDTSENYQELYQEMEVVKKRFHLKDKTMGRIYNSKKKKLCYPDDFEDEIAQGEYFPRKYRDKGVSIEYMSYYMKAKQNTFGLVVLLTKKKKKAERYLAKVKKHKPDAFLLYTEMYSDGCFD